MVKLREQGKTQAEVDAALATQFCWQRVNSASTGQMQPLASSGNGDVSVNAPVFYHDTYANQWNVSMNWNWVNDSYASQTQGNYNQTYNVGGADGVGVTLSSGARITSPIVEYWGKGAAGGGSNCWWYSTYTAGPSTANSYGVGFIAQDKVHYFANSWCNGGNIHWADLNMEHGQVLFNVDNGGSCENIHAYGAYNHTWSSTSVNSVSVAPWSIGFGWNSSSNQWSWSSGASAWAYIC